MVAAGGARGGGGGGGDDGDGGRSLCLLLVAVTTDAAWRSGGRGGSPGSSSVWVWREGGSVGVFQHRARAGLSRVPGWKLSASGWSVTPAEEAAVWQCGSGHLAPDRRSRPTGHCVQPGLLPAQHLDSARTTTTTTGRPSSRHRPASAWPGRPPTHAAHGL